MSSTQRNIEPPFPSQAEVVAAYNSEADLSHALRDNWSYMTSKQLTDFALLDAAELTGACVLNVGCFYPIDELLYAHRVRRWVATDLGAHTISVAREAARASLSSELYSRLEFKVADGTDLPFDDGEFDITVSMSTLDHVVAADARQRFVSEMARVTRGGGRVVVTVPNRWSRGYARRASREEDAPDWFEYCFSPPELKTMIRRAGLEIVQFRSTSELPILAPRLFFPRRSRRPLVELGNAVARNFGVRIGVLARKSETATRE
jgi:SAM-dependent methyltransferase